MLLKLPLSECIGWKHSESVSQFWKYLIVICPKVTGINKYVYFSHISLFIPE